VTVFREHNFDGLVGPTHNYGGLSCGNLASMAHGGDASSPRRAALEGLAKMRLVASLGVRQAVLPPHERPSLAALRRLGFRGTEEHVLAAALRESPLLLRSVASAAAMWAANAATVAPCSDAADGRLHIVPANLAALLHRSLEAEFTERVLSTIFADETRFVVHRPLAGHSAFGDEGAANHTRLAAEGRPAVHLFAWGRRGWDGAPAAAARFPARQTLEASRAVARLLAIDPACAVFAEQHPRGIDAGGFHTDVLAGGTGSLFVQHERAFHDMAGVLGEIEARLGAVLVRVVATERELPIADAVSSYVFNSQVLTLDDGTTVLLAPEQTRDNPHARAFVDRLLATEHAVDRVEYFGLSQSMRNGGGPACLRLRVPLTDDEASAIRGNVLWTPALDAKLCAWVERHYRDRLEPSDLADPLLMREGMTALDELTRILDLGALYDFQR
jgi:succinylarginine dihydrolase